MTAVSSCQPTVVSRPQITSVVPAQPVRTVAANSVQTAVSPGPAKSVAGYRGPPGPQGEQGEAGPEGPQGETGATGAQGPTGSTGAQGPQGEIGPAGEQGEQGVAGNDGADGADGLSAYEVAVENGFEGTEAEWLESLVGEQGPQGIQGPTGATGATGATGPQGDPGEQGEPGETGPQGDPGPNEVTTATLTNITGVLYGDGSNVRAADHNVEVYEPGKDLVITGDGTLGTTLVAPGVAIGVEVGVNDNAHIEIVSPTNGVAYIDLTTVTVDAKARISYWDTDGTLRLETGGHSLRVSAAGVTIDGDEQSGVNTGDQDLSGYALTASLGSSAFIDEGDLVIAQSQVTGLSASLSAKLDANTPITGATKTKITYDADGLVTAGADATTADIAPSTDRNYTTDAQQTLLGNTSGTNSGDQNLFSTIAVSGQSNVVADATSDTLTLAAGTSIAITTNAGTDTITIAVTGLVIGSDVQAYNATLAAVAGGTYTGDDSITTVGTIGAGVWQGTAVADAYIASASTWNSKQPGDATLTALAAYNTNGLLTQTSPDTFTGRTITGTANQIDVTNGSGVSGNPTLSLPGAKAWRGHLYGLGLSNNVSDANNDIDIAVGVAWDAGTDALLELTSGITKRLDASWAVGSGNGGIDTSSKANTTWYHVWLIRRSDTGVVDALFSTSASSPTMPANYDQKRRIGAVLTNGSGNIRAFVQDGDRFEWSGDSLRDLNSSSPATTSTLLTVTVPTGITVLWEGWLYVATGDAAQKYMSIASGTSANWTIANGTGRAWVNCDAVTNGRATTFANAMTTTSGQIKYGANTTTSIVCIIDTKGWVDSRGRV